MTAQSYDCLIYNNFTYDIATNPFCIYLESLLNPPQEYLFVTKSYGGYDATWEVKCKRLYLIDLIATVNGETVGVNYFFPHQHKVFAGWFSGEIRMPLGKCLEYRHAGYASIYEKDVFFRFDKGFFEGSRIVDNRKNTDKY